MSSNSCFIHRDLTWEVADFLKSKLDNTRTRDMVKGVFERRGLSTSDLAEYQLVYGENTPVAKPLAISIIFNDKDVEWFATRTRSDKYSFSIDCMVKSTKREVSDELIGCFASTIQEALLSFNDLQFEVPGTNRVWAYDSWADNVKFGYKNDGAFKVGRIQWWAKIFNPYVTGEVARPIKPCSDAN